VPHPSVVLASWLAVSDALTIAWDRREKCSSDIKICATIAGAVTRTHERDGHDGQSVGRPMNETQRAQSEGHESRQRTLDAILELLGGDAISFEQMRESAMALAMFEGKLLAEIDRIGRSYDSPKEREVRTTLLLGIALRSLEKLV
jgi:hypothetical protein